MSPAHFPSPRRPAAMVLLATAVVAGCSSGGPGRFPQPPRTPQQHLGPDQPPVVWVGGTITELTGDRLQITEPAGSVVTLRRLAGGATAFYRSTGSQWRELPPTERVPTGEEACVEVLMDGANLLALRVFLDAGCGPA